MYYGDYGYHTIRAILEKGLDQSEPELDQDQKPGKLHRNLRGPRYYA
jgi:hypothetical protein